MVDFIRSFDRLVTETIEGKESCILTLSECVFMRDDCKADDVGKAVSNGMDGGGDFAGFISLLVPAGGWRAQSTIFTPHLMRLALVATGRHSLWQVAGQRSTPNQSMTAGRCGWYQWHPAGWSVLSRSKRCSR
jgi:hypothetical protein